MAPGRLHTTTATSKARIDRSTAASWTQDDEDEYVVVERPTKETHSKKPKLKWVKAVLKKVASMISIKKETETGEEIEPVDVEAEFLKDREGMDIRYGGDGGVASDHGLTGGGKNVNGTEDGEEVDEPTFTKGRPCY